MGTTHRMVLRAMAVTVLVSVLAAASAAAGPSATAADQSCGTGEIYKSDGTAWRCTFAEEFDGPMIDVSTWVAQETATSGYQNGGDCFVASANNIEVSNGTLTLTTRKEPEPFTCSSPYGDYTTSYTSGMVSTWGRFAQAYGRYEIRAKFPAADVPGLHGALWLWPVDAAKYGSWPASGEIDIAEVYSQWSDRAIPFIHYETDPADSSVTNNYCMIDDVSAFHTYAVEWTPTTITVIYDGTTCLEHTIDPTAPLKAPAPFDQPFLIALTQTLGQGTNALTSATPLPASTHIDYVRVWS